MITHITTGSTPENIAAQYAEWVKSIKDAPVLCGIADIDQSLVPIWELVDDEKAANNLQQAFIDEAERVSADLSRFDSVPKYITDIVVLSAPASWEWVKGNINLL